MPENDRCHAFQGCAAMLMANCVHCSSVIWAPPRFVEVGEPTPPPMSKAPQPDSVHLA